MDDTTALTTAADYCQRLADAGWTPIRNDALASLLRQMANAGPGVVGYLPAVAIARDIVKHMEK